MRTKIQFFILLIVCFQCTNEEVKKKELLFAENSFDDLIKTRIDFKLYSDSTYIFSLEEKDVNHEKNEIFKGRYITKNDSILFSPFHFDFVKAEKAVIKNNFIEFLGGRYPLKIKIQKSSIVQNKDFDTLRFSNYALFTYDSNFYNCFSGHVRPSDLNNDELVKIDSILNLCFIQNKERISRKADAYFKQCIAVINSDNEKEVWIHCLCKDGMAHQYHQYQIVVVHDGGDCFLSFKINLSTLKYYDLHINGLA